ncbi:MAG TPA: hypothetical protein G4O19_01455 [Dehalococcoidia bacterium]|nr:hypothetical protein [Dehalococcoidia bacterium]
MFNRRINPIDDILDKCLERILVNGDSVEDCLTSYRQYADELKPLLQTALTAMKVKTIKPRADFKTRARYQFHLALKDAATKKQRRFFGWPLRWATMASLVLTLLLSGGGIVAAASNSMPDSPFYQIKLATEQIQLFLTTSPEAKAKLTTKLVDRRVDEIIYMANNNNADMVEATTRRLEIHLSMIASIANELSVGILTEDDGVIATKMVTRTVTVTVGAGGLLTNESPETTPLPTTDAIITTAGEVYTAPTTPIPDTTVPSSVDWNGEGFEYLLGMQSAENISALNAAMETASEEVKAALMEAITLIESGIPNEVTPGLTSTVTETVTTTLD